MPDALRDVMLADFASRVARLEPLSPGIGQRPIPALGRRSLVDAMHLDDMWELIDRTLNRHEETIQHEMAGYEAFLVEGLEPDRFVWLRHAVLGRRTTGPMAVRTQVKLIDSHSGLLLADEHGMSGVWTVEPAAGQAVVHGGFAAKPGGLVRLHLYRGDRVFSLDDLIDPVGFKVGPRNASRIAAIRASMLRSGTEQRRRVDFVGEPA